MKGILTRGQITKYALTEMRYRGCVLWNNNNVRAVPGRVFTGRLGVPDIIGFHKLTAIFVGIEVKTVNDKLSKEQLEFFEELTKAGGIGLIAWEPKPGIAELTKYGEYMLRKSQAALTTRHIVPNTSWAKGKGNAANNNDQDRGGNKG